MLRLATCIISECASVEFFKIQFLELSSDVRIANKKLTKSKTKFILDLPVQLKVYKMS